MQNLPSELIENLYNPVARHRLGRMLDSLVGAVQNEAGRVQLSPVPASSSAPGAPGQVAADASYLYVCVGVNVWRRVALGSF
jgi:hypothetical protein